MILGLDIGGANTKAASSDGSYVESIYLPLWKGARLQEALEELAERTRPRLVAAVMTGELADCYPSKEVGVAAISESIRSAFTCPVHLWGVRGFSKSTPLDLAAANWSASAALVSQDIGDCLFVDMGSTTTDLIPIKGRPLARASDYQRLARGELIYTGMLRTGLCALLPEVELEGCLLPTSSELFAITADAYLAAGEIGPDQYSCDAPDGAARDIDSSLKRLARTVCADIEEIGREGALSIARQALARQEETLSRAIARQVDIHGLDMVVAAGIGEAVIRRASAWLPCQLISERYGKAISRVFPAYAVARLLEGEGL